MLAIKIERDITWSQKPGTYLAHSGCICLGYIHCHNALYYGNGLFLEVGIMGDDYCARELSDVKEHFQKCWDRWLEQNKNHLITYE